MNVDMTSGEITTAMLCACLPVMSPILRVIFPKWPRHAARSLKPSTSLRCCKAERAGKTARSEVKTFTRLSRKDRTVDVGEQKKPGHISVIVTALNTQSSMSGDGTTPVDSKKVVQPMVSEGKGVTKGHRLDCQPGSILVTQAQPYELRNAK